MTTGRKRRNNDAHGADASAGRAFTLIELLVVLSVIGIMVAVGTVSITAGKAAARVKGATRDIFGAIRHARSVALVTGQPAIITYSTGEVDGEVTAKIEINSAKLFSSDTGRKGMQTLTGAPVVLPEEETEGVELVHVEKDPGKDGGKESSKSSKSDEGGGETVEEILFAPIDTDIVKGMRLKVLRGDEELQTEETGRRPRISVFSNVDYLLGRFKEARDAAAKKAADEKSQDAKGAAAASDEGAKNADFQEPVSIVWESNGRVEPHKVWVYADGKRPEDGLMIRIDRFGAAKVLSGDGREDDE